MNVGLVFLVRVMSPHERGNGGGDGLERARIGLDKAGETHPNQSVERRTLTQEQTLQ